MVPTLTFGTFDYWRLPYAAEPRALGCNDLPWQSQRQLNILMRRLHFMLSREPRSTPVTLTSTHDIRSGGEFFCFT